DAAYEAWRAALAPEERDVVVGLRVRWEWPESHTRQAPDAREFRVYLQPGRSNAIGGIVPTVPAGEAQGSGIEPALPGGAAGSAFRGTILQVAGRAFTVVDSEPGPPMRLHVRGSPPARGPCALVIPPGHPSYTDYRAPAVWQERYHVVGLGEHVTP